MEAFLGVLIDRVIGQRTWVGVAVLSATMMTPLGAAAEQSSGIGADDGTLTVSGSVRLRHETLAEQARAGLTANDDLVSLRTTLFAEYKNRALRIGAELYDSRACGGDAAGAVSATDVNALELAQAYGVNVPPRFLPSGATASLAAGRFILNLGSRRLVSADDYRKPPSQ